MLILKVWIEYFWSRQVNCPQTSEIRRLIYFWRISRATGLTD